MARDKLTVLQQQFVDESLAEPIAYKAVHKARTVLNLGTLSDAVAAAQSTKWLKSAKIQAAVAIATEKRNKRTQIDQDWVINKLVENIAFAESLDQPTAVNGALAQLGKHTGGFGDNPDGHRDVNVKISVDRRAGVDFKDVDQSNTLEDNREPLGIKLLE